MLSLEPNQSLIMGCGIFEFSKSDIDIYRKNIITSSKRQKLDKILQETLQKCCSSHKNSVTRKFKNRTAHSGFYGLSTPKFLNQNFNIENFLT